MAPRVPAFFVILAALAAAAVMAGCGQARETEADGAAATAETAKPIATQATVELAIAKDEFIARADAICERMASESAAAAKRAKTMSPAELGKTALELQGRALRELHALPVPSGDEQEIRAVLRHMELLQKATRMLVDGKGEDALPAVAGIAVHSDAVARTAHNYGMFKQCSAYQENPEIQRIMRGEDPLPLRGPDGKVITAPARRPAPIVSPAMEMRRLAKALIPAGRHVLRWYDCTGESGPRCVIYELARGPKPVETRQAEIERLARRAGWKELTPTRGEWPPGMIQLRLRDYSASISLPSKCKTQMGDGPDAGRPMRYQCADRIMILESL